MSPQLHVARMSGAGNDFIVLDGERSAGLPADLASWTRRICRRGLSVGADGVLVVSRNGPGTIGVRFLNPDGSEAFCANGSRCAARFALLRGMADRSMVLDTVAGEIPAEVVGEDVRLTLRSPVDRGRVGLEISGERHDGWWIEAGSLHFVEFVDDPAAAPLERWGPVIRRHPAFGPVGVNVNLGARSGEGSLVLRTWERGVENETLACGSGAVASAFAARLEGAAETIRVLPRSGIPLEVSFLETGDGPGRVVLAGDARLILEARLSEEATVGF